MSHSLDPAVLHSFLEEVRSYLPALEQEAARLRKDPEAPDALSEIHRLAHSVRSACEMIGLEALAAPAREAEELAAPSLFGAHALDEEGLGRLEAALEGLRRGLGGAAAEAPPAPAASFAPAPLASAGSGAEAAPVADEDPVAEELVDTFLSEAEQLLDRMDGCLRALRQQPGAASQVLSELRHHAHTFKGAAGMAGLETASRVAHRTEDLLDLLIAGKLPAESEVLELLQASHDLLADLAAARGNNRALKARVSELLEQLGALLALCEEQPARAPGAPEGGESEELAAAEEPDSFLIETFLAEAESNLAAAEAALRELAAKPADPGPSLLAFRRAVHTIKGAAGMVGLGSASTVARKLQSLLDGILGGATPFTEACLSAMGSGFDLLAELIAAQGNNAPLLERARHVLDEIAWAAAAKQPQGVRPAPARSEAGPRAAEPAPAAEAQATVRVPVERLAGIARILSEIFMNASGFEQQIEAFRRELDELSLNLARIRRISNQLVDTQESGAPGADGTLARHEATSSASEFDVLEFDRYTRLNLLARDLAEATTDLSALSAQFQSMRAQFDMWAARQRGLSGEAQDQLMRLRMVPLASLSSRLDRTVRVTASKTGKLVRLETSGMDTEFDKTVVEQLAPVLEHLLRNAIGHGIEPPAQRIAAGKPDMGTVRLSASRQGAHVTLQLSDDGAGLDYRKIARRAVELEWLSPTQAQAASEEALARLIFEPGFSTSDTVSEISGRGVGMNIVRSTVESLRGRLSVQSAAGRGTTFTIVLPVSMAVDRVVIVQAGGEKFALPMEALTRQMAVLDSPPVMRGGQPGVGSGEDWVPAVWLGEWLGLAAEEDRPRRAALIYINNGEREIAVVADRVIEAREVVIKPLTGLLARITRFSGATILGDGSVVLILNPSAFDLNLAEALPLAPVHRRTARQEQVLIVDDSISIRRSLANLLRAAGWRPLQARDGLEALEMLERTARPPDAIIMDIEMPRMDGYELAAALRSRPGFDHVPILMLTSRAGDKHRQKALRLGVDRYLIKPCPDDLLVAELRNSIDSRRGDRLAAG
ncbi:MAG: Hpt domain-containing protein [Bryobacteraceae bacterium]|nr:Hpt domain-containing protein [Bryobacteraceae bacterium]